jgi:hypothetical protein
VIQILVFSVVWNCNPAFFGWMLVLSVRTLLTSEIPTIVLYDLYPVAQPYYSKKFQRMITPYLNNSFNFCNRESAKDEIKDKFDNTIFDSTFHHFLLSMTDGKFINLSEDKLQLIDQVYILYKGYEG